ncbi:hypothetical protein [Alkalicoccus saliphilus]|uniref:Uncharacterized protein n=1 Tax=Alkalicoccus saliphilus TaxID=200989 RepID=A0A2T4U3R1_9BACI|nr:hypothetical protein [Alkalicoccus saliphilus]PTL38041.1 hypothetical protein C6Y45_13120 [Alkalicoccus saliphilus]
MLSGDFFKDISKLLTDLDKQDKSASVREEETEMTIGGKTVKVKTESAFTMRVGLPDKEELQAAKDKEQNVVNVQHTEEKRLNDKEEK